MLRSDNNKMKEAIVLIGIPGSGKSTLAARMQDLGAGVVSTDRIREKLWGNADVQGDWAQIQAEIEMFLKQGLSHIVFDATHYRPKYRRATCDLLRDNGYTNIAGMHLAGPLLEFRLRNKARSRIVSEDVILNMASSLRQDPPKLSEGFNHIITIQLKDNDWAITKTEHTLGDALVMQLMPFAKANCKLF